MPAPQLELTCPKCGADMRQYERNGVTVDQCTGCRGVFLDRGELERLVDAEAAFYERPRQPGPAPQQSRGPREGYGEQGHRKRKHSFLSELFD